MNRSHRHVRAFTLAEALLASVVLALAVAAVCGASSAGLQQNQVLLGRMAMTGLGRQLMEMIVAQSYAHLRGWDGYSDRSDNLVDMQGRPVKLGRGPFVRRVTVQCPTTLAGQPIPAGDAALVTVRVIAPDGSQVTLSRLFTRCNVVR